MSAVGAERWMPVAGYPAYEVSDQGRVRSWKRPKSGPQTLRAFAGSNGYLAVTLHGDEGGRTRRVAHLVAAAFHGARPEGLEVCHNNGIKTDNRAVNLRYDTPSANRRDTILHGKHHLASRTHCKWGHAFTPDNTRLSTSGTRVCITCRDERNRLAREALRAARALAGPRVRARETHCRNGGHELTEANTYVQPSTGHRVCRTCVQARKSERRAAA